jgi:hypothetical protein
MKTFLIIGVVIFFIRTAINDFFIYKLFNYSKLSETQKKNVKGMLISILIGFTISIMFIYYMEDILDYLFLDDLQNE